MQEAVGECYLCYYLKGDENRDEWGEVGLHLSHDRSRAVPAGCSEAGLALPPCPTLKTGDEACICPHPLATACRNARTLQGMWNPGKQPSLKLGKTELV